MAAQAGETEQAVTEFREAANLLKTQGRIDEFVRVAERILYYQPDDQALSKDLASCYLDRNNARAALARLKAQFRRQPNDPRSSTFWPVFRATGSAAKELVGAQRTLPGSTPVAGAWRSATRSSSGPCLGPE